MRSDTDRGLLTSIDHDMNNEWIHSLNNACINAQQHPLGVGVQPVANIPGNVNERIDESFALSGFVFFSFRVFRSIYTIFRMPRSQIYLLYITRWIIRFACYGQSDLKNIS